MPSDSPLHAPPKSCCFTIDDNIRFLEELHTKNAASIFESPYLRLLHRLYQQYACKTQLNMFFSNSPGSFSLADCTERYRDEFCENASWLRFSFHARHNLPAFPYAAARAPLLADFRQVMTQLERVVGPAALARTTTLHYATASRAGCRMLRQQGVLGLMGMFYNMPGKEALRYYLSPDEAQKLRGRSFWHDPVQNLVLARNDLILNQIPLRDIEGCLECAANAPNPDAFLQVMIHEQYFYQDYAQYQPDFADKLELCMSWLQAKGYAFCFLEERLAAILPPEEESAPGPPVPPKGKGASRV